MLAHICLFTSVRLHVTFTGTQVVFFMVCKHQLN